MWILGSTEAEKGTGGRGGKKITRKFSLAEERPVFTNIKG